MRNFVFLGITDSEEKELYMLDILHQLPKPNKMTALYLFEHLRRFVDLTLAPWLFELVEVFLIVKFIETFLNNVQKNN